MPALPVQAMGQRNPAVRSPHAYAVGLFTPPESDARSRTRAGVAAVSGLLHGTTQASRFRWKHAVQTGLVVAGPFSHRFLVLGDGPFITQGATIVRSLPSLRWGWRKAGELQTDYHARWRSPGGARSVGPLFPSVSQA